MNVIDLFSGIGGFSLGLERAGGFRTIAFCEVAEYPRAVLARHWPGVPIYHDIRAVTAARLYADGIVPDFVCGGFPCQDISFAGLGAGLNGARSGLWFEMLRIIDETRPRWVIAENVAALRSRGLETVLGSLASIGYDAEWHLISASAIGARHRRDRIWIVAYPGRERELQPRGFVTDRRRRISDCDPHVANAGGAGLAGSERARLRQPIITEECIHGAIAQRH